MLREVDDSTFNEAWEMLPGANADTLHARAPTIAAENTNFILFKIVDYSYTTRLVEVMKK